MMPSPNLKKSPQFDAPPSVANLLCDLSAVLELSRLDQAYNMQSKHIVVFEGGIESSRLKVVTSIILRPNGSGAVAIECDCGPEWT